MTTGIETPEVIKERYPGYYGLDVDVVPAIPMKGLLGWTGTAWEKIETDGSGNLKITGPYVLKAGDTMTGKLSLTADVNNDSALYVENTDTAGAFFGSHIKITGVASGLSISAAVKGEATGATGWTHGGYFISGSEAGAGSYSLNTNVTSGAGGWFVAEGATGSAFIASETHADGVSYGVVANVVSANGYGLYASNDGSTYAAYLATPSFAGDFTGKVQASDALYLSNGSAAAPAIAFTGDPNTGIFSGGADILSFATGGVTRGYFNSAGLGADGVTAANATTLTLKGTAANGASAVGATIGSAITYSTTGAKLVSFVNNTTEKAYIDKDGGICINGSAYFNAQAVMVALYFNTAGATGFYARTDIAQFLLELHSNQGRQLVIGDVAGLVQDYDHATQTNPTLFIHSATAPDTNNTQWISLTHNQTDGVIDCGTGTLNLGGTANVNFAGATRTASTVTHDAYVTLEVAGTSYKFMLGS